VLLSPVSASVVLPVADVVGLVVVVGSIEVEPDVGVPVVGPAEVEPVSVADPPLELPLSVSSGVVESSGLKQPAKRIIEAHSERRISIAVSLPAKDKR
jgi:hypothetical protein